MRGSPRPTLWLTGLAAALACGAACAAPPDPVLPVPGGGRAPPAVAPVFVYVYRPGPTNPSGDPLQQLRLAHLQPGKFPWAYDVSTLADNLGDGSSETFQALTTSPRNRLAVAYSIQLPLGAIDHDLRVFDLSDGSLILFFNEHSLAPFIHRATCPSPAFDAFIAGKRSIGVTERDLADDDFQISVEGADSGNVPQIAAIDWVDDEVLHLRWPQWILMGPRGAPTTETMETFDLQVRVTRGEVELVSCRAPASEARPPWPIIALDVFPGASGAVIHAGGRDVLFGSRKAPPPGMPPTRLPRRADLVAGSIPRTGPYAP